MAAFAQQPETVSLLTVKEAATRFRVHKSTVYRLLRSRWKTAARRVGRRVFVDALVAERLCTPATPPVIVLAAEKIAEVERSEMLQRRWQEGSVSLYRGKKIKTWYGVYRIDEQTPDGRIVRKQRAVKLGSLQEIPTKAEARRKLRDLLPSGSRLPTVITLSELVERWKKAVGPTVHDGTRAYYEKMLSAHIVPKFGHYQIAQITKYAVELWLNEQAKSFSRSTVKGQRIALGRVMTWAVDHGWLEKDPTKGVKLPRQCAGRTVTRTALSREQVIALAGALEEPYATLIIFLAATGLRIAEATAVSWSDLTDGVLQVRGTKTRAAHRRLPLPMVLVERLEGLRSKDSDLIFRARNGSPINPGNALKRYVRPAAEGLGFQFSGFHDCRHTAITQMLRDGADSKLVATIAGHASTRITLDVYRHTNVDELRAPMEQLLGIVRNGTTGGDAVVESK